MDFNEQIIRRAYNGEITSDVRSYVISYYLFLLNKQIANPECSSCIRDAAIEILIKMNDKRKYIVKSYIPLLHKGRWYTQPTLTDEIAEEYLKENPKDITKFARFPKTKKAVK